VNEVAAAVRDDPPHGAARAIARLRFTLLIGAVVVALSYGDRTAHVRTVKRLGINWHTLASGQVWRLATAVLIQGQPGLRWSILLPFVWVGIAEWHLGWRRTAIAFFLTDWLSTVSVLVVLRFESVHSLWSAQQIAGFDSGSSSAIYGTLAAFCASRTGPNAWIAPGILVQSMITIWLTNHRVFDVQHLVAIAVGLMLGFIMRRRSSLGIGGMMGADG
jgi:hypothetical protein